MARQADLSVTKPGISGPVSGNDRDNFLGGFPNNFPDNFPEQQSLQIERIGDFPPFLEVTFRNGFWSTSGRISRHLPGQFPEGFPVPRANLIKDHRGC